MRVYQETKGSVNENAEIMTFRASLQHFQLPVKYIVPDLKRTREFLQSNAFFIAKDRAMTLPESQRSFRREGEAPDSLLLPCKT